MTTFCLSPEFADVVFFNILSTRQNKVLFLNGQYSTEGIAECGIPQRSGLVPLLFCIFVNDLPLHITNDNVVCNLFADNNSSHSWGINLQLIQTFLQEGLSAVSTWCNQNRMIIHPHKTKFMVLTTRQNQHRRPLTLTLTLGKIPVQQVREQLLKWHSHIGNICKHLSRNIFLVSQLRHYVDSDTRKILFQAHLLSHINYPSTVWSGASEVHLKSSTPFTDEQEN